MDIETKPVKTPFLIAPAPPFAESLRGLQLLQVANLITLAVGLIAGALRTHFLFQMQHSGVTMSMTSLSMSAVSSGWNIANLGTIALLLMAMDALAKSPSAARVTGLSQVALIFIVGSLLLNMLSMVVPYIAARFGGMATIYMFTGAIHWMLECASSAMIVEVLLRLRSYAAPEDREVSENEGAIRAGIYGAMAARLFVSYLGLHLSPALFHNGIFSSEWIAFGARAVCAVAFYGGIIWLVLVTGDALRAAKPTAESTS